MEAFSIDRGRYRVDVELGDLIRKQIECSRKLEEVLGVNLILECDKAVEKALDIAVRTASMYDRKTYAILASPPAGEVWAYRCSRDRPFFIEACKGGKHIMITYDRWIKALVGDAMESMLCIRRGEISTENGKHKKRKTVIPVMVNR